MHGSGGDWSTPKRSSKSKKKLRHCWVSHWRRQTATTSHDGCSCCPGADTRSDRQCLRGSERVARQRLPPTRPAGPAVGRALSQTEPTACADHRGTTNYARPSARAALCRSGTRRSLRQPARRGRLPLLDPHHVRAHETRHDLVCRLLLEKKNLQQQVVRGSEVLDAD